MMAACEKCWADAVLSGSGSRYVKLINERHLHSGKPCTPEQQAGPDATVCDVCKRKTVHQHTGKCTACPWEAET